jgi:ribosomal protein S18 acetylase RimI-like enzyme
VIRAARPEDGPAIAELRKELVRYQREVAPGHPSLRLDEEAVFGRAGDPGEPGDELLVAEDAGRVVGFVRLAFRRRPWGLAAEVAPLVVAASHRGRGIGTHLLGAAERRAAGLGAAGLRLDVILENAGARRFYERAGYEVVSVRYGKEVTSGPSG